MSIQRMAAPGGVANMLSFLPAPVAPRRDSYEANDLKTSVPPAFWPQLFSEHGANWPAIQNATVRVGQVKGGFIFSVEDANGLLVVGGGALESKGPAWAALLERVRDFRQQISTALLRTPGGAELIASWNEQPMLPATGPWLVLIPMIGLRYYTPEVERILDLVVGLAQDLLVMGDLGTLPQ